LHLNQYGNYIAATVAEPVIRSVMTSTGPSLPPVSNVQFDATASGNTIIYTNNSGKTFVISDIAILAKNIASLSVAPVLQIGSSSSGSDIYGSTTMTSLSATNKIYHFGGNNTSVVIPNGSSIYLDVTVAATATTALLAALVSGYYI